MANARRTGLVLATTISVSAFGGPDQAIDSDFHVGDLAVLDVDGDGRLDVVGAGYYEDQLAWWRQPSEGPWVRHVIDEIDGASQLALADLNGDGRTDIVVASQADDAVRWYERVDDIAGEPTFLARIIVEDDHSDPASLSIGDLDGDGFPDVAVGFAHRPAVHIYRNVTGTGHFLGQVVTQVPVMGNGVSVVDARDFNGDGIVDLVAATPWDSVHLTNYYWFAGEGDGAFGEQRRIGGGLQLHGAYAMDVADFDGDGRDDVVAMSHWEQNNTTVNVFFRLDDAGLAWSDPKVIDDDFAGADSTHALRAVDLDGDGDVDLAGGSSFVSPGLRVWWNRGDGSFVADPLDTAFAARAVVVSDLDDDGRTDVLAGSWGFYTGEVRVWTPAAPCRGDLNRDGTTDAADLLAVFAAWGEDGASPADLDGSGTVDLLDGLEVLATWGPC